MKLFAQTNQQIVPAKRGYRHLGIGVSHTTIPFSVKPTYRDLACNFAAPIRFSVLEQRHESLLQTRRLIHGIGNGS
jgi:hypothetical protein